MYIFFNISIINLIKLAPVERIHVVNTVMLRALHTDLMLTFAVNFNLVIYNEKII